ncbi:MAG: hypothetical protein IAA73_06515 [Bacteroidetes bacterium]|uniref:Outer membrane protein beta-barrel domain-containing protein n=1 Tax=Candidatus Gallipaludibacter merdavium TaxID=2840839 RepID=A0A9D9N4H1_9BACT|nr:hypothetical protein [Candidatus Gallipaludibacter merdavium]
MKPQKLFVALMLATFGVFSLSAQENLPDPRESKWGQIRMAGMYNTLSGYSIAGQINLEYEQLLAIPKVPVSFGVQSHIYMGYDVEKTKQNVNTFNSSVNMVGLGFYAAAYPLNMKGHRLSVGGGYAFGGLIQLSSQPGQYYMDHGYLVRLAYDYNFGDGFTLGALIQYTDYCHVGTTPDLLSVGISLGFQF